MASESIDTGPQSHSRSHSTQRNESFGSSSESGNQMDLSLPKEPKAPIISVQNVSTRDGKQVESLSQSGSSYGERLMSEIRKDMSWLLAASIVGFVMCFSSFLSFLIAVVYCGIHGYMKRGEKEERMRRCQEYLDKSDEGKKQFLNRINLTHLLQKLNKGNKNEGSSSSSSSSCEWLNELISQFWPFLNQLVQKEIDQRGFSLKGAGIEAAGSKIKFDRLTLGDRAPSISHITLVEGGSRDDEIVIDCLLLYYGNCLISFSRRALRIFEMKIGLKDIYFQADARITLRPVLNKPPFVGGLIVTLKRPPLVDFEGFNLGSLADNRIIKNVIKTVISRMLVEPNKISVSFMKEKNMKRSTVFPAPKGLCYFEVIEIADIPHSSNILAKNQVYCIIKVGEIFFQSPVNKSEWNGLEDDRKGMMRRERRNVQVNYSSSVPLHDFIDIFSIQVIDKDTSSNSSSDGSVGNIHFQLSSILGHDTNGTRQWLPLNRSMSGRIHFRLAAFSVTSNPTEAKECIQNLGKQTHIADDIPFGFLSIFLHEIRSYPAKEDDEQRPFILIRFSGESFTSKAVTRKLARIPQKLEQSCHFLLNRMRQSRLLHIVVLDSYKVSTSQANKPDFIPLQNQILASRSFKISPVFDLDNMSFESTINMYHNHEPIIQVSMFLGITVTKYDATIYHNFKESGKDSLKPNK